MSENEAGVTWHRGHVLALAKKLESEASAIKLFDGEDNGPAISTHASRAAILARQIKECTGIRDISYDAYDMIPPNLDDKSGGWTYRKRALDAAAIPERQVISWRNAGDGNTKRLVRYVDATRRGCVEKCIVSSQWRAYGDSYMGFEDRLGEFPDLTAAMERVGVFDMRMRQMLGLPAATQPWQ